MMEARLIFMALVCLCIAQLAFADPINLPFKSTKDEVRYEKLIKETRCVVCQNLSLFDSNSALANDMRQQIHAMVTSGTPNPQIRSYLRSRYGDSIMFMPPWRASTAILWFGPLFMLGAGFIAYKWFLGRRQLLINQFASC